jgi:lysophospholipase L1-like esterase
MSARPPESYPYKFQQLMAARYTNQTIEVENAGKPAEAAADGMLPFPGIVRAFSPEVVVLLHGVNDVSFFGLGAVPRVAEYVNSMARDARLAGAEVVLCTLPPNRPGGFRATDPAVIAAYNTALRDVARGEDALLVDFERDVDLSLIGLDGVHPTEAGYARMADVLFEANPPALRVEHDHRPIDHSTTDVPCNSGSEIIAILPLRRCGHKTSGDITSAAETPRPL